MPFPALPRPSLPHLLAIGGEARMPVEAAALVRSGVWRGEGVSPGRGGPVLLIPGFMAGDGSLSLMTRWLRRIGHRAHCARIGTNVGCSERALERLGERLSDLHERYGAPVAIVGHSRGGMLGRALVARHPERVGHLVTLGSPLVAEPRDLHPLLQLQMRAMRELPPIGRLDLAGAGCARAYDTHRAGEAGEECCSRFWADLAAPLPAHVAFTSLYTRSDGVVRWRSCLDPEARCVEVPGSHCGLAFHPEVLRRVAETLAHPLPRPQRRARPVGRAHLALAA